MCGLVVLDEIFVVGFDNLELLMYFNLLLIIIDVFVEEMGMVVVGYIFVSLNGEEVFLYNLVEVELILW